MKAIFFDLDDTLYDATIYFSSAFKEIAAFLARKFSIPEGVILDTLWTIFRKKGSLYTRLFDDALISLGLYPDDILLKEIVEVFHEADTKPLLLYEDVREVLQRLFGRYKLGIITNGNAKMQRRKVRSLELEQLMSIIVYTEEIGAPKPASDVYQYATHALGLRAYESVYVGDNPYVDFVGAKRIGMYTIRVLRGEFRSIRINQQYIDAEIKDFSELERWLQIWETNKRTDV